MLSTEPSSPYLKSTLPLHSTLSISVTDAAIHSSDWGFGTINIFLPPALTCTCLCFTHKCVTCSSMRHAKPNPSHAVIEQCSERDAEVSCFQDLLSDSRVLLCKSTHLKMLLISQYVEQKWSHSTRRSKLSACNKIFFSGDISDKSLVIRLPFNIMLDYLTTAENLHFTATWIL